METGIVEKISEYVPLFDHKILEQKYEKLQQEHESLMKTVEVLKSTLGFTLDLVNKQEHELLPNEIIQDWENNISEMQKRIWRNQGTESCQPLEEPGATNPSLSAREDSLPEVHMKGSKKKREKKREKKKKEDSLCDEKMVDDADQIPPQDPAHMSCSQEENRNPKRDRNSLEESNIANVTVEQGVIRDVNAKTQSPRAKRKKKKRKTKESLQQKRETCLNAHVKVGYTGQYVPDSRVSHRSIFRRPFVSDFLDFCFERFDVAIWSSRRIGLDHMVNVIMANHASNLVLCFDQNKCTLTDHKTLEKKDKPLFLKDLRRVWDSFEKCNICGNRKYNETNTLLVDDSPDKALSNPPHTAIFPYPYKYKDTEDSALGPAGELKKYLELLANADNVQKFVAENPFGQPAITETHESWHFYSKVVEEYK